VAVYGVIADIHGNLEAAAAVFDALERRGVRRTVCLGDLVGFNADPNAVIEALRERGIDCIAGNHDLIGIGRLGADKCADKVVHALRRTRSALNDSSTAFLAALPESRAYADGFALIHGGVDDVEEYMRSVASLRDNGRRFALRFPGTAIGFFGHTHEQRIFDVEADRLLEPPTDGMFRLLPGRRYLVNPGSVDAARKTPPARAQFAIFDSLARSIAFHDTPYDDATSERKAAAGGYRITRAMAHWMRLQRLAHRAAAKLEEALRQTS
jgi:predicted phosphodiesterase